MMHSHTAMPEPSKAARIDIENAKAQHWDAIVVGTGMGGGSTGYALAKAGKKVLFIEKGNCHSFQSDSIYAFPERQYPKVAKTGPQHRELLRRAGRYCDEIVDQTVNPHQSFIPILGSGLGGSSALYGAALERFFPEDFDVRPFYPRAAGASLVPWPINYGDLEAYYRQAEKLFQVHGDADPLRRQTTAATLPRIPLTPIGETLRLRFVRQGLHPYRLPVGHFPRQRCTGCQATLCVGAEKSGAGNRCVEPAISRFSARILDRAEVIKIVATADAVQRIHVQVGQQVHELSASCYVLAAGALETPRLLLRSRQAHWPTGLGNQHDQVGRYLMRHYMDLYIVLQDVFRRRGFLAEKELAFNDFYLAHGTKFGTVQSLGNFPDIRSALCEMAAENPSSLGQFFGLWQRWGAELGMRWLFPRSVGFATIMEDLPYAANRVQIVNADPAQIAIRYQLTPHERERIRQFRTLVKKSLSGTVSWLHPQAENNQRLAHACGTCRMGLTPKDSVVDPNHQVHGIDNLYVVDASVFPTSSGINPALTIAALGLRAAEHLLGQRL